MISLVDLSLLFVILVCDLFPAALHVLVQTDFACAVYMFEDEYVEYLVRRGILPPSCSRIRSPDLLRYEVVKNEPADMMKVAVEEVEKCTRMLQASVKDAEANLKDAADCKAMMCNKIDKIGERLLFIGLANLVVVVLVLLVLSFK